MMCKQKIAREPIQRFSYVYSRKILIHSELDVCTVAASSISHIWLTNCCTKLGLTFITNSLFDELIHFDQFIIIESMLPLTLYVVWHWHREYGCRRDADTKTVFFPRLHTVWTFNELERFLLSYFPLNWRTLLIHLTLLFLIQISLFHTVYGTCMSIKKKFMSPFLSSHLTITFEHFSIPQLTIYCLRYQPKCTYIRSGTSRRKKFKSIVNIRIELHSLKHSQIKWIRILKKKENCLPCWAHHEKCK